MPSLPLFPFATIAVPGGTLPLVIFEDRYRRLIGELLQLPEPDRVFGVIAIRRGHEVGAGRVEQLYDVGTAVRVEALAGGPGGIRVRTVGVRRFRLEALTSDASYPTGDVTWVPDEPGDATAVAELSRVVQEAYSAYRELVGAPPLDVADVAESAEARQDKEAALAYAVLERLHLPLPERQRLLAAPTTSERLQMLAGLLRRETGLAGRLRTRPGLPPSGEASLN